MRNIATIPARDREALFRNTAAKMGMSEAIIEIDLILDWRVLGCGINKPWEERSNTKQGVFNKEAEPIAS